MVHVLTATAGIAVVSLLKHMRHFLCFNECTFNECTGTSCSTGKTLYCAM